MKTYLKIFVVFVVIIGAFFWAVNSIRSLSYSGTNLNIDIGAGAVTVTNSEQVPVSAELVSPATSSFSIVSTIVGAGGSSTLQGTGSSARQSLAIELPSGVSQFTVTRGTNVNLSTPATTKLDVSVEPLTETDYRVTIIAAGLVILGALFYISKTTDYRWIPILGAKVAADRAAKLAAASGVQNEQGPELRAYGDNRANRSIS